MSRQQQVDLDATLRQAPIDPRAEVAALRSGFEALMKRIAVPSDVTKSDTKVGGLDATEVTLHGIDSANVILYFHGGVYVIGSADSSVPLVADLARRTNAKVISVDY